MHEKLQKIRKLSTEGRNTRSNRKSLELNAGQFLLASSRSFMVSDFFSRIKCHEVGSIKFPLLKL